MQACVDFHAADAELERAMDSAEDESCELFALHKRWEDACLRAASMTARTESGRRAKAAMLLAVMEVTFDGDEAVNLHKRLAESLARDMN